MLDLKEGYDADIDYTFGNSVELKPLRSQPESSYAGLVLPAQGSCFELGLRHSLSVNTHPGATDSVWHAWDFNQYLVSPIAVSRVQVARPQELCLFQLTDQAEALITKQLPVLHALHAP